MSETLTQQARMGQPNARVEAGEGAHALARRSLICKSTDRRANDSPWMSSQGQTHPVEV
jgi:hypothetical protein